MPVQESSAEAFDLDVRDVAESAEESFTDFPTTWCTSSQKCTGDCCTIFNC